MTVTRPPAIPFATASFAKPVSRSSTPGERKAPRLWPAAPCSATFTTPAGRPSLP